MSMEMIQQKNAGPSATPQTFQAAQVLQMGVQDLRNYVETALQENPVFELPEPGEERLADRAFAKKLEQLESGDRQDAYYQDQDEEDEQKDPLSSMGYYLNDENDLSRFLRSQFIGTQLEPEVLRTVEQLCDRLDADGFLSEEPEELAASLGVSTAVVYRAITELQAADPAGVGARSRTECFRLQIERHAGDHRLAALIVEHHMDDLARERYDEISLHTGYPGSQVRAECDLIRSLNPRPGRGFSSRENMSYVTPDVLVLPADEGFEVQINEGGLPLLKLSNYYNNLMMETTDIEVQTYLAEKLSLARSVVDNIRRRHQLLNRCAQQLVIQQEEFFRKGQGHLRPLTLCAVSGALGVDDATLRCVLQDKYLQCVHGIYPLSWFFSAC